MPDKVTELGAALQTDEELAQPRTESKWDQKSVPGALSSTWFSLSEDTSVQHHFLLLPRLSNKSLKSIICPFTIAHHHSAFPSLPNYIQPLSLGRFCPPGTSGFFSPTLLEARSFFSSSSSRLAFWEKACSLPPGQGKRKGEEGLGSAYDSLECRSELRPLTV